MTKSLRSENLTNYWNKVGKNYSLQWQFGAKEDINNQELSLVVSSAQLADAKTFLDIGVGNGRIIKAISDEIPNAKIFGIDVSDEMIKIAQELVPNAFILKSDLSSDELPFNEEFNFISIIRVFQYFSNWQDRLLYISTKLSKGGILVFTLPNPVSINIFRPNTGNEFYRASIPEVLKAIKLTRMTVLSVKGFSKLPEKFYELSNNKVYIALLNRVERILHKIFKSAGSRVIFMFVKRTKEL